MKTFITHYSAINENGELITMEGRIKAFGWLSAYFFLWITGRSKKESIYGLLIEEYECENEVFQRVLKEVKEEQI